MCVFILFFVSYVSNRCNRCMLSEFSTTAENWFNEVITTSAWGLLIWWVTHICVSKLTIIGSDNGLSPNRRQAIIWTNAGKLLIGPLGTNFSEMLIEIYRVSFKKMHLKMSSAKWRPFCLGLNVLRYSRRNRSISVTADESHVEKLWHISCFQNNSVYKWLKIKYLRWCHKCLRCHVSVKH